MKVKTIPATILLLITASITQTPQTTNVQYRNHVSSSLASSLNPLTICLSTAISHSTRGLRSLQLASEPGKQSRVRSLSPSKQPCDVATDSELDPRKDRDNHVLISYPALIVQPSTAMRRRLARVFVRAMSQEQISGLPANSGTPTMRLRMLRQP